MRICIWAEHTIRAGRVYAGVDLVENDDIECVERDSREELVAMAAEWASRSGCWGNQHSIRCGRNILDYLNVVEEAAAFGIIADLGLEIGTAKLAWCRVAIDMSNDGTLSPSAMQRLSNDPRHHTETSLRSALILIGCSEEEGDS